jgi:hypothetical protein
MKNTYEVVVGDAGTMPYTSKKLATDCFNTYVALSKSGATRAANEPVTLLKNGEVIEEYTPNLILAMFDLDTIKLLIAKCPSDQVVILCPHWSINKPNYDRCDPDHEHWDFLEMEDKIGYSLLVSDYDDLIIDVHNLY